MANRTAITPAEVAKTANRVINNPNAVLPAQLQANIDSYNQAKQAQLQNSPNLVSVGSFTASATDPSGKSTLNPYDAFQQMYNQRTAAIEAQTEQAKLERQQREKAAQETLANANRGVYTTYKQAINPYGSFASQNNFSSGVSDYYKNASYGTMLQGIGTNQYNYNDAMQNSNSLWQQYLAQKAGDEAEAYRDYTDAVVGQQKYDKEQADAEKDRQEAIRQYNLNLQLKQEQLKAEEAARAEDQRRYEQEWAYKVEQDRLAQEAAKSGGSGGGGSRRSGGGSSSGGFDFGDLSELTAQPTAQTASYRHEQNGTTNKGAPTIVKVEHKASGVKGKKYQITHYSDGTTKYKLVNA